MCCQYTFLLYSTAAGEIHVGNRRESHVVLHAFQCVFEHVLVVRWNEGRPPVPCCAGQAISSSGSRVILSGMFRSRSRC